MQFTQIALDERMRELTQHGAGDFPIQFYIDELFRFPGQCIPLHWHPELELWQLQKEISRLEVKEETLYRPFFTLSQGEQTKVLLAVCFLRENAFLLIDEPTNHLDREARKVLDMNKSERHIRGGMATREKYLHQHG